MHREGGQKDSKGVRKTERGVRRTGLGSEKQERGQKNRMRGHHRVPFWALAQVKGDHGSPANCRLHIFPQVGFRVALRNWPIVFPPTHPPP